ncbi:MAG: hypothetical protein FJ390_06675 [Verrucomicrobia bacterium]|nr:hypothetical protein [Verrucomicrobiota bacterium]
MTPLQFDQEIHEAIQQKTEEALQLLDETQSAENQAQLRACLNAVTYLSSYSELYFNQESLGNLAVPILTNYEKLIVQSLRQTEITPVDKQKGEEAFERQVIWDFNSSFQENMRKFALVDSAYFPANNKFFYDDQRVGELTFTKDGSALEFRHQRTVSRVISSAPKERVEGETVARKILPNLQQNSGSGGFTTPPRGRPSLNIDTNLDDARTPAFTRCRVLSGISVAALVAAIAYEYYLHSLQLSSQAASGQATSPWGSLFMNQSSPTTFLGLAR